MLGEADIRGSTFPKDPRAFCRHSPRTPGISCQSVLVVSSGPSFEIFYDDFWTPFATESRTPPVPLSASGGGPTWNITRII